MAGLVRFFSITSPATSREFVEAIRNAIDDGTLAVPIVAVQPLTTEQLHDTFRLRRGLYGDKLIAQYTGTLDDGRIATVTAHTHPDMCDAPAQLTFIRQLTP